MTVTFWGGAKIHFTGFNVLHVDYGFRAYFGVLTGPGMHGKVQISKEKRSVYESLRSISYMFIGVM
jgi:hypothetical protein